MSIQRCPGHFTEILPRPLHGPDEIPPIVLSTCASALRKPLHYLISLSLDFGYLPADWKVHKIIPVFKSGDRSLIKKLSSDFLT